MLVWVLAWRVLRKGDLAAVYFGLSMFEDVRLMSFSLSSFWRRCKLDNNGHILTRENRVKIIWKFISSFFNVYELSMWGCFDDVCISPVVWTVDLVQSHLSISNHTMAGHPLTVPRYLTWPFLCRTTRVAPDQQLIKYVTVFHARWIPWKMA